MRYRKSSVWVLALLAAGCKPTANAVPVLPASEPTPAQGVETSTPEIGKSFRKGMPYAEMRKQLLAAGWLPLRDPKCWENLGDKSSVCNHLPEVVSCSGNGRCAMRFANSGEHAIEIEAHGRYQRWNAPGEEMTVQAKSWRFSNLETTSGKPIVCPSQDFDPFLKAFASDEKIKRAFIAPLVKVAELRSDDDGFYIEKEGYTSESVYVSRSDYRDFNVDYKDGSFHFIDYQNKTDSHALDITVTQEGENIRFTRYLYGMSEGNSYRFERKNGCWYLTEDPEPPSP